MPSLFMDTTPLKESRDYRRIWMGSVFSTMGFQITAIAIALEIFSITGSPGAVGLTGLVAVGPLILGGLYGGVIADTYDRRKVALLASISMWLVTVAIAVHAWMGLHNIWLLYGLVALESLLQPINQAARGAIIPRLVRRRLLPAANA
ncbi:MFS transporter [Rothia amarae]